MIATPAARATDAVSGLNGVKNGVKNSVIAVTAAATTMRSESARHVEERSSRSRVARSHWWV